MEFKGTQKILIGGEWVSSRSSQTRDILNPATLEKLAASGVRYFGNQAEKYFCFPTCGGIGSLQRENLVFFGSDRKALAAGYRPCATCRPAAA